MKYFFDTEFHENFSKSILGKRRHFIDLISIGIVGEDGRVYYGVSNEFDVEAAWNSYEIIEHAGEKPRKTHWLRENVLKPLHEELSQRENAYSKTYHFDLYEKFNVKSLKVLLKWHGKSKRRIAEDIFRFVHFPVAKKWDDHLSFMEDIVRTAYETHHEADHEFYAYYSSYDWVVLCTLFGRMIDLPVGFPMYCRDLKQMMNDKGLNQEWKRVNVPDPDGIHNALEDAQWNRRLYDAIVLADPEFNNNADKVRLACESLIIKLNALLNNLEPATFAYDANQKIKAVFKEIKHISDIGK